MVESGFKAKYWSLLIPLYFLGDVAEFQVQLFILPTAREKRSPRWADSIPQMGHRGRDQSWNCSQLLWGKRTLLWCWFESSVYSWWNGSKPGSSQAFVIRLVYPSSLPSSQPAHQNRSLFVPSGVVSISICHLFSSIICDCFLIY